MEILRIENLTFAYPNTEQNALDNINLTIERGEFIALWGESGCGKTTLLKLIKQEIAPVGEKNGEIYYNGIPQPELDKCLSATEIGYVFQDPDSQIVTDKVWHELAFGLENMGLPTQVIRRRVAEMANYFGIQDWFHADTDKLSGGQKQLLNLASVMVMQPKILILDEPTSQLDPIAAAEFIATLQKLNRELGLTIILAEHRLEEVFPIADRAVLMENGKIHCCDTPKNIGLQLEKNHKMAVGLPTAVRIYNALDINDQCPLTVNEGREFIVKHFEKYDAAIDEYIHDSEIAVELKKVWFRYGRNEPDILREMDLQIYKGEFFCILGGNGVGKTTALNVMAGLNKPYRGKVVLTGKMAYLPQNPQTLFIKETIISDLEDTAETLNIPKENIDNICERFSVNHLLNRHPYDLSGGELQKCAIAKMLLLEPKILLLDEPTKGLDANSKLKLASILAELKNSGITIIAVTHDVEFAAENADRCGLFFDGEIVSTDKPEKFFAENSFYTTAANRMARDLFPHAVTCNQVINSCKKQKNFQKVIDIALT